MTNKQFDLVTSIYENLVELHSMELDSKAHEVVEVCKNQVKSVISDEFKIRELIEKLEPETVECMEV